MKKKDRFFQSFRYFAIFATIIFIVIECIVLNSFFSRIRIESKNIGLRSLFEAAQVVNPIFRENEKLIYIFASYVDDMLDAGLGTEEIEDNLAEMSDNYRGQFDTNFLGVCGVVDGVYINGEEFEPDADYVPEERRWYKEAVDARGGIGITAPYSDLQSDETVISFAMELQSGRGVMSTDIMVEDVRSMTRALSIEGIEAVYITDADHNIIFHSMEEFLGSNFEENAQNDEERALFSKIRENENGIFEMNLRGNNCMVFNSTLYGGWTAVVIIDLVKEFQQEGGNIALFSLIFFAFFVAIIFIAYHYDVRRRASENLTSQLKAASTIYRSVHLFDLENDLVEEISSTNDIRSIFGNKDHDIALRMQVAVKHFVTDDLYQQMMLEFVDFDTLGERLAGKNTITQEFIENVSGWCRARFISVEQDGDDKLKKVLFAIEVIDDEKRLENQLRYLSEMDGLTGINNRATGERLTREFMAGENSGMFCLVDVDKFKSINDNFGHGIGDEVLVSIANALSESFRERDIVMRFGGDEFAVFAVGATTEEAADNMISRLFESIDKIEIPEMGDHKVKISLGATFYAADSGDSFEDLYTRADEGMYTSKKSPGNTYTIV